MFHRETDAAKVARNRDAIFDLHARAIEYMERYTAIPYAFGKFDFVLIPSFQFGGMEHPGAVFYNASSLLLDETATQMQTLGRALLDGEGRLRQGPGLGRGVGAHGQARRPDAAGARAPAGCRC